VKLTRIIPLVAGATMVAACGSSTATQGAGASTGSSDALAWAQPIYDQYSKPSTDIGVSTPLNSPPAAHKKVAWLEPSVFAAAFSPAAKAAAQALNWDLVTISYDATNPTALASAMQQAINQKVEYITSVGSGQVELGSALTNAKNANIPVFSAYINGANQAQGSANGIYVNVAPDAQTTHQGEILAATDVVLSGGPASMTMFVQDGVPPLKNVADGWVNALNTHCSACKVDRVSVAQTDVSAGKVPQVVATYVQSHPDVKILAFCDGPTALGVDTTLKTGGLLDKVKITGQSPEAGGYASLLAGTNDAWVSNPFRMVMWYVFDAMARYSEGMSLDVDAKAFIPNQIYTKNTDKTLIQNAQTNFGEGPPGYQNTFKQLWKVA
jgi:ABC-type sugar transport system substrate-binding protein